MTRHELKEQLQHDQFTDAVSDVVGFALSNREKLIRWAIVLAAVLVVAGGAYWFASYRRSVRQQDLAAAFAVLEAPIGQSEASGKSFPTQEAKTQASIKALSDVIAKDGGSREGLTAQYYRGTLRAQSGDSKGAETDLRAVANSNVASTPLAKIALARLLAGQNRMGEAQTLLRGLIDKPTDLVSKAQAQLLLAELVQSTNPQEAKKLLQSLRTPGQDPVITRAADQIASQLNR